MMILHDDVMYRHLRFRNPGFGSYWFDLITIPGTLIFQGDGESYVFSRVTDMFEFFRGSPGRINPQYWSEKLTSTSQGGVRVYDEEIFKKQVQEVVADALKEDPTLIGLTAAVEWQILSSET